MEMWGGAECTVNRVGDRYRDQTLLTGHHNRAGDVDAIAALGIRKLRTPVLWERIAPDDPHCRDWRWSDDRMAALSRADIEPIVGLIHHGSGPRYTSLIDDRFPELLAEHARAVAERYPHVADWTPVNEPLTTARFSALYGVWYPHARDPRLFWLALLNQIDATRQAMHAIRRVVPGARLIQTEDLGETFATEPLSEPAAYYNNRRWLSWDLLCGRGDPGASVLARGGRVRVGRPAARDRGRSVSARHHRRQPLRDKRSVPRSPGGSGRPSAPGCRLSRSCRGTRARTASGRPWCGVAPGVGSLSPARRGHRMPHRLHARGATALVVARLAAMPSPCATKASMCAR